ncbi:MAG: hypothetical protein KatS3mg035_1634 [Bacteroidia bacterium]|nr:MAG: hypothetical protein KatS3mg035_1634 [Bacteroidia bacterium]
MDNETFEQVHVPAILIGDGIKFLKEGMEVKVSFEGDEIILAEPPTFVELEITYTEPGVKGDTATNTLKPATLETGGNSKRSFILRSRRNYKSRYPYRRICRKSKKIIL